MHPVRLRRLAAALALLGALGRATAPADEPAAAPKALDPKLRLELIKGGRGYLHPEEDPFKGKAIVRSVVERAGQAEIDFLGRMDLVRDLANQGRGFLPDFFDKAWQKLQANTEVKEGRIAVSVSQGDRVRLAYALPKKEYVDANLAKIPRPEPFPTLVTLIEEKDYTNKPYPGEECISRRYASVPAFKEIVDRWILFAPIAVRGNYFEGGNIRQVYFGDQFKYFFQRYYVDFERLVLDGEVNTVLPIASVNPFLFAGLLVRKPLAGAVQAIDRDLLKNYAGVPVFVLHDADVEKALKEAGHPNVTRGDEAAAAAWLKERRRTPAKSFEWTVRSPQHTLAHWLILEPDWNAEKRTLKVEVLDTPQDPNTIRIEAAGILDFSALLNDEIVCLTREVRVVVNGKEVAKQKFDRSLEQIFERDPVNVRDSMNYGFLFSAVTPRTFVPKPPPKAGSAPATGSGGATAGATDQEEAKAEALLKKGEEAAAGGNAEAARKYLEKVIADHPGTKAAVAAKAALAKLDAGK